MLEWDHGTAASTYADAYTFQSEQKKELLLWKNGPIFHRLVINKAKKIDSECPLGLAKRPLSVLFYN